MYLRFNIPRSISLHKMIESISIGEIFIYSIDVSLCRCTELGM